MKFIKNSQVPRLCYDLGDGRHIIPSGLLIFKTTAGIFEALILIACMYYTVFLQNNTVVSIFNISPKLVQ